MSLPRFCIPVLLIAQLCVWRMPSLAAASQIPRLQHAAVNECSGLATSSQHGDVVWMLNDSGGAAALYAANLQGQHLATVHITGVTNRDWEDLAYCRVDGKPHLLIADVGDNAARHEECLLHLVPEPRIAMGEQEQKQSIAVTRTIRFRYQGGPVDVEAVAVDQAAQQVLLMSKIQVPVRLYAVPLAAPEGDEAQNLQTAKEIARFAAPVVAPGNLMKALQARVPTAMTLSADGGRLLVATYSHLWWLDKTADQSWARVVQDKNWRYAVMPSMKQLEAVSLLADGRAVLISEGRHPPVHIMTVGSP